MELEEILEKILSPKERGILKLFYFLNRELINKSEHLSKDELGVILDFLKRGDKNVLTKFWGKDSLKEKLFFKCTEIYDYYQNTSSYSKVKKNTIFKEKFAEFYQYKEKLNILYLKANFSNLNRIYDNKNFSLYEIHSRLEEEEIEGEAGDVFFHFILSGVFKVENTLLFKDDIFFSTTIPIESKSVSFGEDYSKIILKVKKAFLKGTSLEVDKVINKKLSTYKLGKEIGGWLKDEERLKNSIPHLALYLFELVYNNSIDCSDFEISSFKIKVVEIIEKNICSENQMIIEKILEELKMSFSKFQKLFKTFFGTTVVKFIEKLKIDKSCYLILTSDYKIGEIADKLNFSETIFTKKFISYMGISPSAFKKRLVL